MSVQTEGSTRTGNTADWAAGPILEQGEVGINTETGEVKTGDGATAFALLRSVTPVSVLVTLVAGTKLTNDARIRATSTILPLHKTLGTVTAAKLITVSRVNGVSFTLTSTDNTDTSTIEVLIWY